MDHAFYNRPTLDVARDLIGCRLCREMDGQVIRLPITETEAYDGPEDRACHAFKGRTQRTEVLFGPAGIWYVYLCYGIHWMLNVVAGPDDYPAAVLIRGAGEFDGPGKLTKALRITGAQNQMPVSPDSALWIEVGAAIPDEHIQRTPRIGVNYAGPDWSQRRYRFVCDKI